LLALVELATLIVGLHLLLPPLRKDLGHWFHGALSPLQNDVDQLLYAEIAQRHKQLNQKGHSYLADGSS